MGRAVPPRRAPPDDVHKRFVDQVGNGCARLLSYCAATIAPCPMSTASSPPLVNDIVTQAPDAPTSAPDWHQADPFAYLDAEAHARESATLLSCARALQHASRDRTPLYLSLLVPELRRLVDRGLRTQAWHSAEGLQHVDAPELRQFPSVPRYAVLRSGERVICLDSASVYDTVRLKTSVSLESTCGSVCVCIRVYVCECVCVFSVLTWV